MNCKHLDESLESLSSKLDIPIEQKISKSVLTRLEDEENLFNSFVEGVNESQKELNSEGRIKFIKSKLQGLQSLFDGNLNPKFESLDTKLNSRNVNQLALYSRQHDKTRSECYNYLTSIPFFKRF